MKNIDQPIMALMFGAPSALFFYAIIIQFDPILANELAESLFYLGWVVTGVVSIILFLIFKKRNMFNQQTTPNQNSGMQK